jgi:hypothetical protein
MDINGQPNFNQFEDILNITKLAIEKKVDSLKGKLDEFINSAINIKNLSDSVKNKYFKKFQINLKSINNLKINSSNALDEFEFLDEFLNKYREKINEIKTIQKDFENELENLSSNFVDLIKKYEDKNLDNNYEDINKRPQSDIPNPKKPSTPTPPPLGTSRNLARTTNQSINAIHLNILQSNFPDYFDQSFSKIKKDPMKIFSLRPQSLKEDLNSLKENFVISIVYKKKEKQKITKAVQNLYQFFDFYLVKFFYEQDVGIVRLGGLAKLNEVILSFLDFDIDLKNCIEVIRVYVYYHKEEVLIHVGFDWDSSSQISTEIIERSKFLDKIRQFYSNFLNIK